MKKSTEKANTELIVVTQLPVIEDQLQAVKATIEERVKTACSLVCTEETYKEIKKIRSDLNKEYLELEKRRRKSKARSWPLTNSSKLFTGNVPAIFTKTLIFSLAKKSGKSKTA